LEEKNRKEVWQKMEKIVSYDSESDILMIHKGFKEGEKFGGNIDIGDFILDLSSNGTIRGIELLNASEHLQQFGITKKMLESSEGAKFIVRSSKTGVMIAIKFDIQKKEIPASFAVPLQTQKVTATA